MSVLPKGEIVASNPPARSNRWAAPNSRPSMCEGGTVDMSTVPPSHIAGLELGAAQRFDLAGGLLATISPFGNTLIVYEMPNRTTVAVRGAFTLPGSPYRIRLQDGRAYVAWIPQTPIDRE